MFDLYPPTDADAMYLMRPPTWLRSAIPPFLEPWNMDPDMKARWPLYEHADLKRIHLEKGDMLYLPFFWWHGVTAGDQQNMIINWWTNPHPMKAEVTYMDEGAQFVIDDITPEKLAERMEEEERMHGRETNQAKKDQMFAAADSLIGNVKDGPAGAM